MVAACTGGDLFIEIAAVFNDSKQKFLIETGSMVSIIKPHLFNTAAYLPSNTTLYSVKGDSIKVHGKLTLPLNPHDGLLFMNFTSLMCLVISLESIFSVQIISSQTVKTDYLMTTQLHSLRQRI